MVRENREHSKKVASKANGKAEPEKPNNVEIGIPENLEEHVKPMEGLEVSHGQKYQGLNQDYGWKVPKQKHNWNIRSWGGFITVIFALVAMSNYFGSSEPPRVARNVSKNNSVQSLDSIHHKSAMLARLMNGIYLQNELTNGSFPTYDFVAEAGGIGDPSMINKIMSLKAKDAVTRMESIKALALNYPEGVSPKLKTLSKFTSAKPPDVLDQTQIDALFVSITKIKDQIVDDFSSTKVDNMLKFITELDAVDDTGVGTAVKGSELSSAIFGFVGVVTKLDTRLKAPSPLTTIQPELEKLKMLINKVKLLEEISAAYQEIRSLTIDMMDITDLANTLDPLMAAKDNGDTMATLSSLLDFLQSIDDQITPTLLIAPPRRTTANDNTWDFNDSWLKKVLNERNSLDVLEKALAPFRNVTDKVYAVVKTWDTGIRPSIVRSIRDDLKQLNMMMSIKPKSGSIYPSVAKLETLVDSLKLVFVFTEIAKLVELEDTMTKFDTISSLYSAATKFMENANVKFFNPNPWANFITTVLSAGDNANAIKTVKESELFAKIKDHANQLKTLMDKLQADSSSYVNVLNQAVGLKQYVDDARFWLTTNNQKDFYDMVPAVNEDIGIVKRMLEMAPKAALNTRRKRAASVELIALAEELAKLGPLKATVDNLKDPSNQNKKTVELKKLSSARQMAAELAYATGALNAYIAIQNNQADIKTISDFAKAVDAQIAKLSPKDQAEVRVGWPGADKVTSTLTALQPEVKKLPAALDKVKADATLNDFADVLAVLDKVPVVKPDVTAILKSLELLKTKSNNAKAVVDVSAALKKFKGLSFASGRKKGALPPMVKKLHAFFLDFFGLVLPTTENPLPPTAVPFFLIIFFIAGPPGGIWLFLWFRWIQKMKRAHQELPTKNYASDTAKSKKSVEEEKPVVTEAKPKSVKESASEVPEEDGPVEEGERKTTEQQEDTSVMNEKRLAEGGQKLDKKAKSVNADKRLWGHKNRMKEQNAKTIYTVDKKHKSYWKRRSDLKAYRNRIVWLKQRIADMEAKEKELRKEIAYNRTVDKWKTMLAENKDEIEVKKQY